MSAISREIFQPPVTILKVFPVANELSAGHKPQFCKGYNHGRGNEGSPLWGLGGYLNRSCAHNLLKLKPKLCVDQSKNIDYLPQLKQRHWKLPQSREIDSHIGSKNATLWNHFWTILSSQCSIKSFSYVDRDWFRAALIYRYAQH